MTDVFFGDSDVDESISLITRVYNALLKAMLMGDLERGGGKRTDHAGIRSDALTDDPRFLQATEAVVLTRVVITQCNNCCVQLLINRPCLPSTTSGQWGTGTELLNERHLNGNQTQPAL